jgi:deoxyribonuclease IV
VLPKSSSELKETRSIGIHVSISGKFDQSVDRATELGCIGVFQIFTCSPRRWDAPELKSDEVEAFRTKTKKDNFQVFAHMPYLPNLCATNPVFYKKSVEVLTREIKRCSNLDVGNLVLHFGSTMDDSIEAGRKRMVSACKRALQDTAEDSVRLLLENSASGKSIGSRFEQIRTVIDEIGEPQRIGVCLDACHAFAAGYDLRTEESVSKTVENFDTAIALDKLFLIHLNDSAGKLGEGRDRHENLGKGNIGRAGMSAILNFKKLRQVPAVLETPIREEDDDKRNMIAAKKLILS